MNDLVPIGFAGLVPVVVLVVDVVVIAEWWAEDEVEAVMILEYRKETNKKIRGRVNEPSTRHEMLNGHKGSRAKTPKRERERDRIHAHRKVRLSWVGTEKDHYVFSHH